MICCSYGIFFSLISGFLEDLETSTSSLSQKKLSLRATYLEDPFHKTRKQANWFDVLRLPKLLWHNFSKFVCERMYSFVTAFCSTNRVILHRIQFCSSLSPPKKQDHQFFSRGNFAADGFQEETISFRDITKPFPTPLIL